MIGNYLTSKLINCPVYSDHFVSTFSTNASGGPDNITAIIIQVSDQEQSGQQLTAPENDNPDDTKPSTKISLAKPDTLPEGKYHVDSNN